MSNLFWIYISGVIVCALTMLIVHIKEQRPYIPLYAVLLLLGLCGLSYIGLIWLFFRIPEYTIKPIYDKIKHFLTNTYIR